MWRSVPPKSSFTRFTSKQPNSLSRRKTRSRAAKPAPFAVPCCLVSSPLTGDPAAAPTQAEALLLEYRRARREGLTDDDLRDAGFPASARWLARWERAIIPDPPDDDPLLRHMWKALAKAARDRAATAATAATDRQDKSGAGEQVSA